MYIIVKTDGYSIEMVGEAFATRQEASEQLAIEFANDSPQEWEETSEEMSYCEDDSALLYNNGDDVFCYQILKV